MFDFLPMALDNESATLANVITNISIEFAFILLFGKHKGISILFNPFIELFKVFNLLCVFIS